VAHGAFYISKPFLCSAAQRGGYSASRAENKIHSGRWITYLLAQRLYFNFCEGIALSQPLNLLVKLCSISRHRQLLLSSPSDLSAYGHTLSLWGRTATDRPPPPAEKSSARAITRKRDSGPRQRSKIYPHDVHVHTVGRIRVCRPTVHTYHIHTGK
jgi:hypothetical protein